MAGNIQLISVAPDGTISTIRAKKDKGLDLRALEGGTYSVRRVSEIVWNDGLQGFTICMFQLDGSQSILTIDHLHVVGMSFASLKEKYDRAVQSYNGVLAFTEYEDAVEVEVEYLTTSKALAESTIW